MVKTLDSLLEQAKEQNASMTVIHKSGKVTKFDATHIIGNLVDLTSTETIIFINIHRSTVLISKTDEIASLEIDFD